jgi:hypothetical protein
LLGISAIFDIPRGTKVCIGELSGEGWAKPLPPHDIAFFFKSQELSQLFPTQNT